jgi:hypothetical protein
MAPAPVVTELKKRGPVRHTREHSGNPTGNAGELENSVGDTDRIGNLSA